MPQTMTTELASQIDARIDARFAAIESKLDTLTNTVLTLAGSIAPRAEVTALLDKRVSTETYMVAHEALEEKVEGLEHDFQDFMKRQQNTLQRAAPWVAVGLAAVSLLTTGLFSAVGIAVTIMIATHAIG